MTDKRTRADMLRRAIADDIITGRLSPGTRLDEHALAQRFGVSRTPVREALRELAATGLAETRPHRGVAVKAIEESEVAALFEAMAEIEGVCARLSALRMASAERTQLEALHRASVARVHDGDAAGYAAMNWEFHGALYRGARNAQVEEIAVGLRARCAPYRVGQFNVDRRLQQSWQEHGRIVTAIMRADAAEAGRAAFEHVKIVRSAAADYVGAAAANLPVDVPMLQAVGLRAR